MGESIVVIIHLVDGVLMLAMMALMFFTLRLLLNSPPFLEWFRKRQAPEQKASSGRRLLQRRDRGRRPGGTGE